MQHISLVTQILEVRLQSLHRCKRRRSLMTLQQQLGGKNELRKGLVCVRASLDKRSEYLCVFVKILEEGVTAPLAHGFHCLHRYPFQQIKQGSSNPDAMALQWFEISGMSSRCEVLDESTLGEGTQMALVLIREKVVSGGELVDQMVVVKG